MPEKLTEIEILKLTVLSERGRRLNAEAEGLKGAALNLEREKVLLQAAQQALGEQLKNAYGLQRGDKIEEDGTILRGATDLKAVPTQEVSS